RPLRRGVADAAPYVGAFPVGAGVLDGPVGRFGTLARGVADAAPYGGASGTPPPTGGADREAALRRPSKL
ncbi:MAG: hypothetical protein IKS21_04280, partial [Oscillospiraceae bacterium]|nr:hypothetical protein [Oscillospiraceae bacterium]